MTKNDGKPRVSLEHIMNIATRAHRQLPYSMRMDGKYTSYDALHKACWTLSDEQIAKVAKYASKLGKKSA